MHMCAKLSHFAVHVQQRLAQHCKSTIFQLKKKVIGWLWCQAPGTKRKINFQQIQIFCNSTGGKTDLNLWEAIYNLAWIFIFFFATEFKCVQLWNADPGSAGDVI